MQYVLLQQLIWHLLRSMACEAQSFPAAHISVVFSIHTLRCLPTGWAVWVRSAVRPEALTNEIKYVLLQLLLLKALAAFVGVCSSAISPSAHVSACFLIAYAAPTCRLAGADDAAVGVCITVLSDLQ